MSKFKIFWNYKALNNYFPFNDCTVSMTLFMSHSLYNDRWTAILSSSHIIIARDSSLIRHYVRYIRLIVLRSYWCLILMIRRTMITHQYVRIISIESLVLLSWLHIQSNDLWWWAVIPWHWTFIVSDSILIQAGKTKHISPRTDARIYSCFPTQRA
jgi:hypothetical protein